MRDKFTVRGRFDSQKEELNEVIDLYSNQGKIPMWMRTFLGYGMKIWLQWLMQRQLQNERGIPGFPESREVNPDDRVYFMTDKEVTALVKTARQRLTAMEGDEEELFQLQVAIAKIRACAEINSKEDWMDGPQQKEAAREEREL